MIEKEVARVRYNWIDWGKTIGMACDFGAREFGRGKVAAVDLFVPYAVIILLLFYSGILLSGKYFPCLIGKQNRF